MKIRKIRIRSILGISDAEFDLGSWNEIRGSNGAGKTSLLEAIKGCVSRGHIAELLRNGEESGEVVLDLDDACIRTNITKEKTERTVEDTEGSPIKKPVSWIEARLNPDSFDPSDFLLQKEKAQVEAILKMSKLEVKTSAMLDAIAPFEPPDWFPKKEVLKNDPLNVIERLRAGIYEDRTVTNRLITQKEGHVKQLRLAVGQPKEPPDVEVLHKEIQAILDADSEAVRKIHEASSAKIADLREQIGKARQLAEECRRNKDTITAIRTADGEIEDLKTESQYATEALGRIDSLKSSIMGKIPIDGLSIRDGRLYYNDTLFATLNTAKKMRVALEIAASCAGELGLIQMDGFEQLDEDSRNEAKEWSKAHPELQFFAAVVARGEELSVRHE